MDRDIGEWETRRRYIDKKLIDCGWQQVVDYDQSISYLTAAVREYPTDTGPADYALFHDGDLLAFVEAKKVGRGPISIIEQAERYAKGISGPFTFGDYGVPFVYASNGIIHAFRDLRNSLNLRREIARFHTPMALREKLLKDKSQACGKLATPNSHTLLRYYQKEAIQAVEEKLCQNKRQMLLAMATGTGKTYTIVSLIYRLMWSGMAKRVLFLVDRRSLAAQAVSALNSFEAEPNKKFSEIYEVYSNRFKRSELDEDAKYDPKILPESYLTKPDPAHSFVYVCTIQRMRNNLFGPPDGCYGSPDDPDEEDDSIKLDIPIHAFDLIIADECHRGYTSSEDSKWREVLEHFDAIKVGLTATPAAHTTSYFKEIAYRYSYEKAVNDGYLVDYDAVRIHSDISMKGMELKEGEEVEYINTKTGEKKYDILEDNMNFDLTDIERKATSPDRNKKIIQEFKKYALDQEEKLGRFPKTLVFAINDIEHTSHADQLVDIINEEFNRGQDFCKKITGKADRPLEMLRKFRNRKEPSIVVTVDMLSTGVDVPKLENILILRAVKSRILFEQMLGRGTRLCTDFAPNKDHFTVFDVYGVIEAFKDMVDIVAEPPNKPTKKVAEIIDEIENNKNRDYNIKLLAKRLLRAHKSVSKDGRDRFEELIGTDDIAKYARDLKGNLDDNWTDTMAVINNPDFIEHMASYPKEKVFVVGLEPEDETSSQYIFKAKDGSVLKPEDYIIQFERFVKENPEQIEALAILLERPKDFSTEELYVLRQKLAENKYTERNLQKAYNREMADILSMVKHVAKGIDIEDPEERAQNAIAIFRSGKTFNEEQEKWLSLIEDTLVKRIILDIEDFKDYPFSNIGGEKRANQIFDGKLEEILEEINEAVLA